jgi:hypothetical protein
MIDVVMMIGPAGDSPAETLVAGGRLAAAQDALEAFQALPQVGRVIVAAPGSGWPEAQGGGASVIVDTDRPGDSFHFGARLAGLCERYDVRRLFYVGAGSLPLLGHEALAEAVAAVAEAEADSPLAVTNNLHSSDWLAVSDASPILRLPHRLPRDNSLGWVLSEEAGVTVRSLPPSAATRVDIDTPFDLLLLSLYPRLPGRLGAYLKANVTQAQRAQLATALEVLARPGSQVAIFGRVASAAWARLEAHTRIWLRVYSEERGMAASGRQDAGQVRSLAATLLAQVGADRFFALVAEMAEAVLVDTRLFLAHERLWPSPADRYRSDLGDWRGITEPWLRDFTRAAVESPLPVVMGGHGVVAGGLYALTDLLQARADAGPHDNQ